MMILNGVYKSHYLNILEYFFIINIIVLFLTRLSNNLNDVWQSAISHLLVSSALLAFLGIVAYHVYLLCKRWRRIHTNTDIDVMSFEDMRGLEDEDTSLMPLSR